MDGGDLQNANPTILNPSDLPSRRVANTVEGPREDGGTGLFDGLAGTAYLDRDIWSSGSSSPSASSGDGEEKEDKEEVNEDIDEQEIYDLIAPISDPEHPISLGALSVVQLADINITNPPAHSRSPISTVTVDVTPTISHCSLATVIGLGVRTRLEQALPPRFRVDVRIKEGSHSSDYSTTKQLADKERVAAALENQTLRATLRKMLGTCV
ncbi:MAG: hypothetical protein M1831_000403 [Alyxoria varia]|nr:MAG: hypothetical protein M1831_000403 [Alyxoria varia]